MDELSASGETLGLSSQWRGRSRLGPMTLKWWKRRHPPWLMLASLTRTEINVPGGSQKKMFRIIEERAHTIMYPDSVLLPSAPSFSIDELSISGETLGLSSQRWGRSRPDYIILGWWGRKHPPRPITASRLSRLAGATLTKNSPWMGCFAFDGP
jgi:hypothetical protein